MSGKKDLEGFRRLICRIDQFYLISHLPADDPAQQRIMGTAENERVDLIFL